MRSVRDHAAEILEQADRTDTWVGEAVEAARAQLSDARDRRLLTELTFGVLRTRGALDVVLGTVSRRPVRALHTQIRTALRLGAYQLLYLDRVPAHAVVDHAVGWVREALGAKRAGFVNGVLRGLGRAIEGRAQGATDPRRDLPRADGSAVRFKESLFPDPKRDRAGNLGRRFACPRWMVVRWLAQYGTERTVQILRAGLTRPPMTLRARESRDALAAQLVEAGASVEPGRVDTALLVRGDEGAALATVEAGVARVQDASSQLVVPLAKLQPGQSFLDLCAAPGGKALHAADIMRSGTVVACDVDVAKVQALEAMSTLAGEVTWRTQVVPADGPLPFEPGSFDAVLVDAPCSNTGVLRRRVEARWRIQPKDIGYLAAQQKALLDRAAPLVKPGGRLLYSTCSLEAEENADVITAFLASHPGWTGEKTVTTLSAEDADGGFTVALVAPA